MEVPKYPEPAFCKLLHERERRLKGASAIKKLETICLESIKHHTDFYLQIADGTGSNPFEKLRNPLKTELLKIKWTLDEWGRWEQMLMNSQVSALRIQFDPTKVAEDVNEFCSSLTKHQPQLEDFSWDGDMCRQDEPLKPLEVITSFSNFANLRSLTLRYFVCKDLHLQMIATHLKKLRTLKLDLTSVVSAKGISALKSLEHLEEFLFKAESMDIGTTYEIYNLCLQILPKLLVLGDDELTIDGLQNYSDPGFFKGDFKSLKSPMELGLKKMILQSDSGIPEGITFPNLTTLFLWDSIYNYRLDSRFSEVSELGLFKLGFDEYRKILKTLGHQIRKLAIMDDRENLQLDSILRLCPNLVELYLDVQQIKVTCTANLNPDVDLKYLEVIKIDLNNNDGSVCKIAPGIVLQLLRAPNLRRVQFDSVDLIQKDAKTVVQLVKQGKMLQKLEFFQLVASFIDDGEKRSVLKPSQQKLKDRYYWMLENMARYCPQFVEYEELGTLDFEKDFDDFDDSF